MLLELLIVVIVLALVLYVVSIIPLDARVKTILQVVVIAIVAIWVISLLVGLPSFAPAHR